MTRPAAGGVALDGVGPGSLLGGRYALRLQLDDAPTQATWQAHDRTLERSVVVRIVPAGHPFADAMLDAARRAGGMDDPRLVRVLDVGREQDLAFVVTELVPGRTLAERLRDGPLPAEDVRTLVGEASLALENARRRGLHHLALTPDDVHQLDDDSVRVGGLAVSAALAGRDGDTQDADAAGVDDTTALVALAYAGLTGCWPLASDAGLPRAPQVSGAPVAPSQIVGGVPADLDTLCAQTFAGAGAPASPGDLAAQIAPWGRARRSTRTTGAFPHPLAPTRPSTAPTPAVPATPVRTPVIPAVEPPPAAAPDDATQQIRSRPAVVVPRPDLRPAVRAVAGAVAGVASGVRAGAAAGVARARQSQLPRPAPASPSSSAPTSASDAGADGPQRSFGGGLFDHDRESPAPLLPPAPLTRPPQDQTRTVLALVAGFVAVFLLLGYCGLRGLGDNAYVPDPTPGARPSATAAPTPTPTTPAPTSTPTAAVPTPVRVVAAAGFDPQGDGSEKDAQAGRATDGDPGTSWTSDTYNSAAFGGLKDGVGLRLDLGAPTAVHTVQVTVDGAGSTVQLRTAPGDTLDGAAVLAEAAGATGTVTLTPKAPVTTRYLVLWFTTAAPSSGGFRAGVAEVTVS